METYLNITEVAKYLGIAEKTIRKCVLNREIPYHKIMKVIRFRVSEIEEWVNAGCNLCPIAEDDQDGDLFEPEKTEEVQATETGGEV